MCSTPNLGVKHVIFFTYQICFDSALSFDDISGESSCVAKSGAVLLKMIVILLLPGE